MMDLPSALARKAKELTEGMLLRVGRTPDFADYLAGFLPVLGLYLSKDATDVTPRGSRERCQEQGCDNLAGFIRFGRALCFAHKDKVSGPPTGSTTK